MNRAGIFVLAIAAGVGPVWASEPGEPQDCDDWVFVDPGLTCRELAGLRDTVWAEGGYTPVYDNQGAMYRLRRVEGPTPCGDCWTHLRRVELVRFTGAGEDVVGHIEDDCIGTPCSLDRVEIGGDVSFDPINGEMLIRLQNRDDFGVGYRWIAAIKGFTTLYEVLHSYNVGLNTIGFRVPYLPEGMDAAEWFDTYWGTLASVGDWSKAQPMQCEYPVGAPSAGDYLTVADTVPTPDPGQGYYYVTAATYQGETRYGRQASAGVLSGRDPAMLPECPR